MADTFRGGDDVPKGIRGSTQGECSVEGCTKPARARGWCSMHYERWRKHGDLTTGAVIPLLDRFWENVDRRGPDECWPWTGRLDQDGYGTFSAGRRPVRAHRFAYELEHGPIPEGVTLDHDCHTRDSACQGGPACQHRRCTNPAHLLPMTSRQNITANRERKTHCKNGHEFTPENTRWKKHRSGETYRECRVCHNARARRGTKSE